MLALHDNAIPLTISTSYGDDEQTGNDLSRTRCVASRHNLEIDVLRPSFSSSILRNARLLRICEAQ